MAASLVDKLERQIVQRVLPQYEPLGRLAFAFMQGSLVSGYTEQSDLDVVVVWDQEMPPAAGHRERVVARLDERQPPAPFVVDYQDVQLERFVIAWQEYNVAHWPLAWLEEMVQAVRDGRGLTPIRVLNPLTAVAGFCYGRLVVDRGGRGRALQESLRGFPERLQTETARVVGARREGYLDDLRRFAEREDGFMFHSVLVDAARTVMQALFAAREVYYPGDKWLREAILRFGLGREVLEPFEQLWSPEAAVAERIEALSLLVDQVSASESTRRKPC